MRLLWFTDTLADVNGVSRFVGTMADLALERGLEATIVTSTRMPMAARANVVNLPPVAAVPMPKYGHLELAWPPWRRIRALVRDARPDVVHVSTPGPVGVAGRIAAGEAGVPIVGAYHTDFPAYVDHLFGDDLLTAATRRFMRWFHRPMARVFTRSSAYEPSLRSLGVAPGSIVRLSPGIRTAEFQPAFRDGRLWRRLERGGSGGPGRDGVKVLYAGRVSVEKNLPLLAAAWRLAVRDPRAPVMDLVIVGDGPYGAPMRAALAGAPAHFLGFRHGRELAAIYASSDLFVFPSATDTLGQVVLEAQSSGLPVLVSDRGGPREVVRDGVTGLVLPAGDAAAWAGAIASLAADAARRAAMADAAHRFARGFDIAGTFEAFMGVHAEVAREHGRVRTG